MKFLKSRRVFVISAALAVAGMASLKRLMGSGTKSIKTEKFLTHEGKLVEVLVLKVPRKKNPVTKEKLISWIWKSKTLS